MATKPELKRAVPKSKIKAVDYNKNFDSLNDYIEQGIADNAINNFEFDRTYKKGDWVLANEQGHNALYESLINNNKGNSVENTRYWKPVVTGGNYLFDLKISDHNLHGEEALGWALQGTYVSESIYFNFCGRCFMEKEEAIPVETEIEGTTITLYKHDNGHVFYDIADKGVIDTLYEKTGMAWYYGIDLDNLRVFLPRDKYFYVKGTVAIAGNGMSLGITQGLDDEYRTLWFDSANSNRVNINCIDEPVTLPNDTTSGSQTSTNHYNIGITTDPTKSGIEGKLETQENKYLYICVGNTVINPEYVDVANLSSDLQFKADKTDVDGQWVAKDVLLSTDFTKGTTSIDLSEYLPNDEYDYEVMVIFAYLQTSGAYCHIYSDLIPRSTTVPLRVDSATTISNGFLNIPVGKQRVLYVYKEQAFNTGTGRGLEALAYRRLGKNQ